MELCTRNLLFLDKLWINSFIWRCWKDYAIVYGKNDQKCGAAVIGSFTTTMPCPNGLEFAAVFRKKNMTVIPHHLYSPNLAACNLFPVPLCERPDEREMFGWCQQSKKENAAGLEQHQHWRVPEMFSTVGKPFVHVYQVKRRVLWRRLELSWYET